MTYYFLVNDASISQRSINFWLMTPQYDQWLFPQKKKERAAGDTKKIIND